MINDGATAFSDHRAKQKMSQRGKGSEDAVNNVLTRYGSDRGFRFTWERIPDARAAGGRFTPVAGDFRAFYSGRSACVEVKETLMVDRLPKKNFSADKIARAYKLSLAGVICPVLIHHTTTGRWAVQDVKFFYENSGPSWYTAGFPSFDGAEKALDFALSALFNP